MNPIKTTLFTLVVALSAFGGDSSTAPSAFLKPDWVTTYVNGDDSVDTFQKAIVDAAGNTYSAGQAIAAGNPPVFGAYVAKIDPNGTILWETAYPESRTTVDMKLDSAGNLYVLIEGSTLVKYDTNGNRIFAKVLGKIGDRDARSMELLADGSLWILSYRYELPSGNELVRVDADGNFVNTRLVGNDSTLFRNFLAVDDSGNAYVASKDNTTFTIESHNDLTGKRWTMSFDGFLGGFTIRNGELYAVGTSADGHARIIKMDLSGNILLDHIDALQDYLFGPIRFDSNGNMIVCGGGSFGFRVTKFDPNFNLLWTREGFHAREDGVKFTGVVLDNLDNIYFVFSDISGITILQQVTILFDPSGNILAAGALPMSGDYYASVGVDGAGTVRISSAYRIPEGKGKDAKTFSFFTAKYSGQTGLAGGALQYKPPKILKFKKTSFTVSFIPHGLSRKVLKLKNKSKDQPLVVQLSTSGRPFAGGGAFVIKPKGTLNYSLLFYPDSEGTFTGTLTISASDPNFVTTTVQMSAQAGN